MLLNPYFWIILAAICASCYVGGCTQGKVTGAKETATIKAEWEADKQARQAEYEKQLSAQTKVTQDAENKAKSDAANREVLFSDLETRHRALASRLTACDSDRGALERMLDAVNTANAAVTGAPSQPASNPPAAAAATVTDWFDSVAKQYAECRQEVIDWNTWYDGLRETR